MTSVALRRDIEMPSVWNAYGYALGIHVLMFLWNPTLLSGGAGHVAPVLMQVEFRDKAPMVPKPPEIAKKPEPKPVVKKAHKSGLAIAKAHTAPITLRPKPVMKQVAAPAPRTRISQVKIPKFVPRASDEDSLAMMNRPAKLATTTALHRTTQVPNTAPVLHSKSRGVRVSDVHFELSDRGSFNPGSQVVNIPIGASSGETAVVASAPQLHNAPKGLRNISNSGFQAPMGEGVGELAGKNRAGYHGTIQVSGAEPSDEVVNAAGKGHGSAKAGQGFELGGPIGDRRILRRHLPEYPQWAEEKGISALVKIFFTVNSDGSIRPLMRIVRSSGYAELDDLAKQALKSWKFSPTTADSSTDNAWGVITFRFTLA